MIVATHLASAFASSPSGVFGALAAGTGGGWWDEYQGEQRNRSQRHMVPEWLKRCDPPHVFSARRGNGSKSRRRKRSLRRGRGSKWTGRPRAGRGPRGGRCPHAGSRRSGPGDRGHPDAQRRRGWPKTVPWSAGVTSVPVASVQTTGVVRIGSCCGHSRSATAPAPACKRSPVSAMGSPPHGPTQRLGPATQIRYAPQHTDQYACRGGFLISC